MKILIIIGLIVMIVAACGGGSGDGNGTNGASSDGDGNGSGTGAVKPVPANSNTLASIRVGDLLNDPDLIRLADQLLLESGLGTFDQLLEEASAGLGFDLRTLRNAQVFGDITSDDYFGISLEGSFRQEDIISAIEAGGELLTTEEYRGHELFVSSDTAISFPGAGEVLIGSPQAVRDMIDIREGAGEALAGPVRYYPR